MSSDFILWVLVLGILFTKTIWIADEIKYFRNRVDFNMLKTNAIETAILVLHILQVVYFPLPATHLDKVIQIIGVIMYFSGMFLAFWGKVNMNRVWGIPGKHTTQQDHLVTTGPFAITRNPIYLGFLLLYFGFAFAIRSWLFVLRIPLLVYFYKSAKEEEKLLMKKFGKKYLTYKAKVPLFF